MTNFRHRLFALAAVLGFFLPVLAFAGTGTIDSTDYQSRLCSNTDCSSYTGIYWNTTNGTPVTITDTAVTGFIWSSSYGWINLDPTNGGVSNTTSGVLSGFAWGQGLGWINFSPTHGGVMIDTTTGEFSGWAWASGAGWIEFNCSLGTDACVKTDWRPGSGTTTGGSTTGSSGHAPPSTTTGTGTTTGTTTGTGTTGTTAGTTGGTIGTLGTGTAGTGGVATTGGTGTTGGGFITGTGTTGGTTAGTTGTTTGTTTGATTTGTGTTGGTVGSGGVGGFSGTGGSGGQGACPPYSATSTLGVIKGTIKLSFCDTIQAITATGGRIQTIFATGNGDLFKKIVTALGVLVGTTIVVTTSLFLDPISFSEIFLIPLRLWSLLLTVLGLSKRRRPWGTVYDSVTKQPLDPAYVTLRTAEGKEVTSLITDLDGRFGFVVPEPGDYSIFVHKTNYLFPSQKLVGRDHDELYRDLYFGEHFHVAQEGDVVIKNIPMDPEKFDWNEFAKKQQNLMRFYSKRDKVLRRIANVLFGIGFFIASIAVLAAPQEFYNVIVFILYVLLYFIRIHGTHSRPYGDVVEWATGNPISYAIIRISNVATGVEIMHRITDAKGRYYALLPNSEYRVRIDRKLPNGTYETISTNLPAVVTKGYLAKKFSV